MFVSICQLGIGLCKNTFPENASADYVQPNRPSTRIVGRVAVHANPLRKCRCVERRRDHGYRDEGPKPAETFCLHKTPSRALQLGIGEAPDDDDQDSGDEDGYGERYQGENK